MPRKRASLSFSASSALFSTVTSRTVACRYALPFVSILVSSTVAGKSAPSSRRWVHSKKREPSCRAASIASWAFSAEGVPSGCRSGDTSQGPSAENSAASFAPNILHAAELPSVNLHEGGPMVIMASHEPSNRSRNFVSLSLCSRARRWSARVIRAKAPRPISQITP